MFAAKYEVMGNLYCTVLVSHNYITLPVDNLVISQILLLYRRNRLQMEERIISFTDKKLVLMPCVL